MAFLPDLFVAQKCYLAAVTHMPAVTCYSRLDCERKFSFIKIDGLVKTSKLFAIVIPAKAGIQ
jgi:hypothetical protein